MKSFKYILFLLFSILFFSCENALTAPVNETVEKAAAQKAYLVFKLVEANNSALASKPASDSRAVTSGLTSALFSHITFSGTRADGLTMTPVTASSFADLSGQSIEIEPGEWTFELEAWLGKTESADGEKYTASKNLSVVAGANEVKMSLTAASSSAAAPTSHPGSWEVSVKFPSDSIDRVEVSLFKYSDFAVAGANPASLTSLFSEAYVKGSDFTASGQQTLLTGETVRACGNYIVYVSFLKNIDQQGTGSETEVINSWGEFMRINPGVKSTGTITLPNAERVYTIQYILGNSEWNPSYAQSIQVCYTRNSGTNGVFTLPGESAFVDRNPAGTSSTDPNRPYQFLGWYDNADFSGSPITSFNVSDAANKIFYAKWKEPVFDVYISASGDDANDGSAAHPVKNATAAYSKFYDLQATNSDGSIRNTIHILSDYTGTNKIDSPWGDGSKNGMLVKFVGEKGGVVNADVTLELDMHECGSPLGPQTFIYIENNQKMLFSHINFTSNQTYEHPNGFACLFADDDTELYFENSTIKNYVANGCAGICAEGTVYLKNCEISENKAINANSSGIWGCAVNVGVGQLHISGSVIIKDNQILKADGSGNPESSSYNVYIGTDDNGTPVFHPVIIDGDIYGSEIWVTLASEPQAFTSGFGIQVEAPSAFFHSDSVFLVDLNASGEAQLVRRVSYYVSSTSESPAGSDTAGDGSIEHPYASIAKAIEEITSSNDTSLAPVIYITGDVSCNTTIVNGTTGGSQLIANSLIIEGTTATSALNGNASGTVLDLRTSVPVTLKNLTIKNGQTSTRGGGLYIDGTNVEINNCIIENNSAYSQGGGVYLTNGAQLTMNGTGSVIRGNWLTGPLPTSNNTVTTNKCGGGLYINSGATFTMNAGTIEGNGAYSGGGVYVRGSFEMNGEVDTTVIQSNVRIGMGNTPNSSALSSTQLLTANVEVGIPGTFTMNGGKITSSLSQGQNGAGVCLYASHENGDENGTATFNMTGGEISGLNISQNAAVYLRTSPRTINGEDFKVVFNMSGGKITGNTSTNTSGINPGGAGVYIGWYSKFNMTGGEIRNNHAAEKGGGVYIEPGTGTDAPAVTLGKSTSESSILIKDNTVGTSDVAGNLYLNESQTIAVAGTLSIASEVGITRGGDFSATPFTNSFGSTNSGTAPADIFTSDEGYTIIQTQVSGSQPPVYEAGFLTCSPSGTIYAPGDYHFTLAASRSSVTLGRAANVTVTPDITRTEPNGNTTPLFYKAADHKLYLDSAFTLPEGSGNTVTWSASLWCGTEVEVPSLSAGTGANANKFTIPALSFENTYTLNVTATYQGYTHNANLSLQCQAGGALSVPLTLEAVSSAATVTFKNKASGPVTYIVNGGEAQTIAANTEGTVTLSAAGDKVEFFGDNARYGSSSESSSSRISCSSDCYIYGNIMSLVNSTGYETANALTANYCFSYLFYFNSKIKNKNGTEILLPATSLRESCYYSMFRGCTSLTTAPELPATTLATACYSVMFSGCTSLTTAPELPATTLATRCYNSMFSNCTSLTTAPELPVTSLRESCYSSMFEGCTSLTAAPELPATTLSKCCYDRMFRCCTSLTTAPELPATTLAMSCYYDMFDSCTSLTTAPELPATTLAEECYHGMFWGCTSLNSVTCLATDISASDCVNNWLDNVEASGTFIKAAGMTDWPSGANGIPSGWTVQDAP